jgi:hypothetical protein
VNERTTSSPAERISQGARHEHWRAGRSKLELSWSTSGNLLTVFDGHGDARFAPIIVRRLDAQARQHERITLLFDAWNIAGYDSVVRVEMTDWCRKNRAKIYTVHVAVQSKLVSMGITVANVVLGGLVNGVTDRPTFEKLVAAQGLADRER